MTFTLGENCDVILVHPNVNAGDPYGFVLTPDASNSRSGISIQREIQDGSIYIYIFFTAIMADELINPDGSEHANDRDTMYTMLLQYLDQTAGIAIGTVIGTFLGIGPLGHNATEIHMPDGSFVSLKVGNTGAYSAPVDSETFFNSLWQDDPPAGDALTWETSIWR
jgi:hypothetical protein